MRHAVRTRYRVGMAGSQTAERVRAWAGSALITVSVIGLLLAIVLGGVQLELISSTGDFALCGSVFRPVTMHSGEAGVVCANALGANQVWMWVVGGASLAALVAGIALRASVPKRLQHRR